MKKNYLLKIRPYCLFLILSAVLFLPQTIIAQVGKTAITRWQYNKRTAVSLTYDDGSRNQFRYALPVMEELHFPATFFIITGVIEGSAYKPKFVGRPVEQIIAESGRIATDKNNFFERASASLYLGYQGALPFYRPKKVLMM